MQKKTQDLMKKVMGVAGQGQGQVLASLTKPRKSLDNINDKLGALSIKKQLSIPVKIKSQVSAGSSTKDLLIQQMKL